MAEQVEFNKSKTRADAIKDTTSGTIYFPTDSTDIVFQGKAFGIDTNTTYGTGSASAAGLTKLYTGTGTATDGTMTQSAITSALSGKAASSHTHTKSQITDFPASLKNPNALVIKGNGTQLVSYDGSAAGTVDLTKSSIGLGNVDNTADSAKSVSYANNAGKLSGTLKADLLSDFSLKENGTLISITVGGTTKTIDNTANYAITAGSAEEAKSATKATNAEYASQADSAILANVAVQLGTSTVGSSTKPIYLNGGTATAISYTLGNACSMTTRTKSSAGDSGWKDQATDSTYVPDMAFIAYWNGAYGGTSSNLAYCNKGAFGTATTLGKGDVVKSLSISGRTLTVTKADGTTSSLTTQDTNTTYGTMGGATSSAAGSAGLVPAPAAGKNTSFLRGDGTWVVPTNTTYGAATTSAAGLMSASDKSKLDGIASGANAYSLPTASSSTLGGVKVGSNISLSSGTISLTKANVTSALGYTPPTTDTNTHYESKTVISGSPIDGVDSAAANGNVHINHIEQSSIKSTHLITGSGGTTVTCDDSGNITISSTDTNTTYSAGSGLSMSGTTINHASSITAGTVGTSSATSGVSLTIPYCSFNATGHIIGGGTHTHTVSTAGANSVGVVKGFHRTSGTATGTKSTAITASPAVNSRTSTAGRFYGVETDATGAMYVNVPWTNTDTNTYGSYHISTVTGAVGSAGSYNNECLYFSGSSASIAVTITPAKIGEVCHVWLANYSTTARTVTISCASGYTLIISGSTSTSISVGAYTAKVFEYIYWGTISGMKFVTGREI